MSHRTRPLELADDCIFHVCEKLDLLSALAYLSTVKCTVRLSKLVHERATMAANTIQILWRHLSQRARIFVSVARSLSVVVLGPYGLAEGQSLVNIFLADNHMLFVEPTLSIESYILNGDDDNIFELGDIRSVRRFLIRVSNDSFRELMHVKSVVDKRTHLLEADTPDEGIVLVTP